MPFTHLGSSICDGEAKIAWVHVYKLAYSVDELWGLNGEYFNVYNSAPPAAGFNVATHPLTVDKSTPYSFSALPSADMLMMFELTAGTETTTDSDDAPPYDNESSGCPTISDRYLMTDFEGNGGQKIDFNTVYPDGLAGYTILKEYADNDKLFFVVEEDDCWCKTIFRVQPEGGFYTLEKVKGTDPLYGCCMTREVPDIGEQLDTEQDIIPASFACAWGDYDGVPTSLIPANPLYCNKCYPEVGSDGNGDCVAVPANDKIEYVFSIPPPNGDPDAYVLERAGRPVTGYFTWPILDEHFEDLYQRIMEGIKMSGGAKPAGLASPAGMGESGPRPGDQPTIWAYDATYASNGGAVEGSGWFPIGATCIRPRIDDYLAHAAYLAEGGTADAGPSFHDSLEKGNIIEPVTGGIEDVADVDTFTPEEMKRPWETTTGGGGQCDAAARPSVYCETIDRIGELITQVADRNYPYKGPSAQPHIYSPVTGRSCCMLYPSFEDGSGCLGYYTYIENFWKTIFYIGPYTPIPGCDDPDVWGCTTGEPNVFPSDCSLITCGPMGAGLHRVLTAEREECLNQAAVVWESVSYSVETGFCMGVSSQNFIQFSLPPAPP